MSNTRQDDLIKNSVKSTNINRVLTKIEFDTKQNHNECQWIMQECFRILQVLIKYPSNTLISIFTKYN